MNKNTRIAKELIKIAKSLMAFDTIKPNNMKDDIPDDEFQFMNNGNEQIRLDEAEAKGKKYILHHKEGKLWRIQACKNLGIFVKKGDFGGLIESENNLSHDGLCWVFEGAKVYHDAKVYDDAIINKGVQVYEMAQVYGNARIYDIALIYGEAKVCGYANVYEWAKICEHAKVDGFAHVYDHAIVSDYAKVYGNSDVYDYAYVGDESQVFDEAAVHGQVQIIGKSKIHKHANVDYDVKDQDITE